MDTDKQVLVDELLKLGMEALDLTESQHNDAVAKYGVVGHWLDADDSILRPYSPTIFLHGSGALGTATRPVGQEEFDLDLVCEMNLPQDLSQTEVKRLVGARLRANATYAPMLEEKNRCWRLIYAGQFHMDILPAKPDDRFPTASALVVPDKALRRWKETDPKGYGRWFAIQAAHSLIHTDCELRAGVEPAPQYTTIWQKRPLQIAVQILKRHRDISL